MSNLCWKNVRPSHLPKFLFHQTLVWLNNQQSQRYQLALAILHISVYSLYYVLLLLDDEVILISNAPLQTFSIKNYELSVYMLCVCMCKCAFGSMLAATAPIPISSMYMYMYAMHIAIRTLTHCTGQVASMSQCKWPLVNCNVMYIALRQTGQPSLSMLPSLSVVVFVKKI